MLQGLDDKLKQQFEALKQFDGDERRTALEVLDGLILKHQARRMVQRNNPATAIVDTVKAAQGSN